MRSRLRIYGRWVLLPLVAVLLTACSASRSPLASQPPAPAASAVAGAGTARASSAATTTAPAASAAAPSAQPSALSPTASPTSGSTTAPTPRPTATQRPATPPPATGGQTVNVSISNFAFVPATITVKVGTRVTWTNRQAGLQHTVTADDGSFDSGYLSTGSSFSHVFTKAGTYAYHCAIHPFMTGTVIVTG